MLPRPIAHTPAGGGATPPASQHPTARVARIVQVISTHFDVPGLLAEAIASTRELTDADGASLLLVDAETGDLYFDAVAGGAGEPLERVRVPAGTGIAGQVAESGEGLWVPDARASRWFNPEADRLSGFVTGSIIAVPLALKGEVVGVLEAVRSVARPPFEAAAYASLEMLAPHVAIALRTARITSELRDAQARLLEHNRDLEQKVLQRTALISRAKAEWERTFDAISEPIALLEGFTIRRANLAYAERAGRPVSELPGQKCHQVLAGRETPCPGCPLNAPRPEAMQAELELGATGTFRLSTFPVAEGGATAVVVHYRDVTAERALEARLRESERLVALGQLASGAAHEINNPLGFLISNLSGLEALLGDVGEALGEQVGLRAQLEPLLDEGHQMVHESLSGARRVQAIVRALRDLSRLEIGAVEPSNVNDAASRVTRGRPVVLALGAAERALIAPLQLDQALTHLVDNALKAVRGAQRVFVETGSDAQGVWVRVRDEGVGIPAEHLPRVFEPFFTTRGVGQGMGLGLTSAYGLVKRAGGTIEVQSEPRAGSTFTIRLRRADAVREPSPTEKEEEHHGGAEKS